MTASRMTAAHEVPIFFDARDDSLFGIYTTPAQPGRDIGVVTLSGGVHIPSANRNRLWVDLNRRLGGDGFGALRFDYRGTGESGGASEAYRRDRPRSADLLGAVDWLRSRGHDRVVLVGTCFGSLTAVLTAGSVPGLVGMVLLSPLVLDSKSFAERAGRESAGRYIAKALRPHVLRGLLDRSKRSTYLRIAKAKRDMVRLGGGDALPASPKMIKAWTDLARRRVPTLVLFGSQDVHWEDWKRVGAGRLGGVIASSTTIDVRVIPGYLHGFPQLAVQQEAVNMVESWLSNLET